MTIESQLLNLKFKKSLLFMEIELAAEVDESLAAQFGILEIEILKLEKNIVRSAVNDFD
jgi:hypothetical protein